MSHEYLLYHTMSSMGDTDIHTIKWIYLSSLTESSSHIYLQSKQLTNTNIRIAYNKRKSHLPNKAKICLYLFYPYHADIEVRTIQSQSKEQHAKLESNILMKQSKEKEPHVDVWQNFAVIDDLYFKPFKTVTIQIYITHNEKRINTLPDLSNLLNDPNYSDATIESCDGVAFKIHKCVLAARSDVFKAHFTHSDGSSTIQSKFEEDVLRELLNFIYSGIKAVHMDSVADRLLVAADFYELNDLKSFCENSMYKQLTEDNVIDTLVIADLHSAVSLKNLAMDFVRSHAKVIFTKPAWADLKSPEILKALYENALDSQIES